jgi:hypothetical protein
VGSSSCSIRLVCTIHASASDLSRKPGIRLHLPLRLFISTLNKCPFCGITRYAMLIMAASMARGHRHCTAGAITHHNRDIHAGLLPGVDSIDGWAKHAELAPRREPRKRKGMSGISRILWVAARRSGSSQHRASAPRRTGNAANATARPPITHRDSAREVRRRRPPRRFFLMPILQTVLTRLELTAPCADG